MPLLHGKLYQVSSSLPKDISSNEEVFQIRFTKEYFKNYK